MTKMKDTKNTGQNLCSFFSFADLAREFLSNITKFFQSDKQNTSKNMHPWSNNTVFFLNMNFHLIDHFGCALPQQMECIKKHNETTWLWLQSGWFWTYQGKTQNANDIERMCLKHPVWLDTVCCIEIRNMVCFGWWQKCRPKMVEHFGSLCGGNLKVVLQMYV